MIITNTPPWIVSRVVELNVLTHAGEDYTYAIVDHRFGLENGIAANFTIAKNGVLAVSDACPTEYRELYLIHEIIESDDTCRNNGVCLRALKEELRLAEERKFDMRKYVEDRLLFFRGVCAYYESRKDTPEGLATHIKTHRSFLHLRSLMMRS